MHFRWLCVVRVVVLVDWARLDTLCLVVATGRPKQGLVTGSGRSGCTGCFSSFWGMTFSVKIGSAY